MKKLFVVLYGVAVYGLSLATSLYVIGFVGNMVVPNSLDSGTANPSLTAWMLNCLLLGLFALQHSVMARQGFKQAWTRVVHPLVQRSTYRLMASLMLGLLFWQWRPINSVVWKTESPPAVGAVEVVFWTGWAIVILHNLVTDYFGLFALRQAISYATGNEVQQKGFQTPGLHGLVRHPVYLGFIIAFWAAPVMTAGHLLFSVATTAYIFIGIYFEERDLIKMHGDQYAEYRRRVPMIIPFLKLRRQMRLRIKPLPSPHCAQKSKPRVLGTPAPGPQTADVPEATKVSG